MESRRLIILLAILPQPLFAVGPSFRHKDPFTQQEFDSVYHDIRSKLNSADFPFHNVRTYGAKGDGVTDDTIALNATLALGGNVVIPKTNHYYRITSPLYIRVSSTSFTGIGNPEIRQTAASMTGLEITSDNVTIDGIIFSGYQHTTADISENGIVSSGTATSRISNITIRNCDLHNWGEQGIRFNYVNGAKAINNHVYDIVYSAIQARNTNYADFSNNHVHDIGPGDGGVLVGICLTGNTTQDEVPYMGVIANNRIHDLLYRYGQGILVEPCDSCSITGNTVTDVGFGIGVENQLTLMSYNNVVTGNTIVNKQLTALGTRISGVLVGGTSANVPTVNTVVSNNHIYGYGSNDPAGYGAIHLYYNDNCSVVGNNISSAAVYGIYLLASNKNCVISENNISTMNVSGAAAGIATSPSEPDDYTVIEGNNINIVSANAILVQGDNGKLKIGRNFLNTTAIADIDGANTYQLHEDLHRDVTSKEVTGVTSTTTMHSLIISSGTMGKNELIQVVAFGTKSGIGGNKTLQLFFGSSGFIFNNGSNDQNPWRVEADIMAEKATGTQVISWRGWNGTTMTQGYAGTTEDTTKNVTIKTTACLDNAADYVTERGFILKRW